MCIATSWIIILLRVFLMPSSSHSLKYVSSWSVQILSFDPGNPHPSRESSSSPLKKDVAALSLEGQEAVALEDTQESQTVNPCVIFLSLLRLP